MNRRDCDERPCATAYTLSCALPSAVDERSSQDTVQFTGLSEELSSPLKKRRTKAEMKEELMQQKVSFPCLPMPWVPLPVGCPPVTCSVTLQSVGVVVRVGERGVVVMVHRATSSFRHTVSADSMLTLFRTAYVL